MNVSIDSRTARRALPYAVLLVLYFLQVSLFGVGLALPFAFCWLLWTLEGLRRDLRNPYKRTEEPIRA